MNKIGHWLNEFLMYLGINANAFAMSLGLNRADRIYNILNGRNNLSPALARKIKSVYPNVSMEWLLTGKDAMLVDGKIEDYKEPEFTKPENCDNVFFVKLVPSFAIGGSLTQIAESGIMPYQCEEVISPIKDVDFAISVSGESMSPEYPDGSRVFIRQINTDLYIEWGKVYVIDTSNGIIIKEVRKSENEGYISCHSINPSPKYAPFDIPKDEIYSMYRVIMCLIPK